MTDKKKVAKKKVGRPLQFEDATVIRMPKGWLKAINAMAKTKGMGQGEFIRQAIGRAIGQRAA